MTQQTVNVRKTQQLMRHSHIRFNSSTSLIKQMKEKNKHHKGNKITASGLEWYL
jgi:hypothetical protein